MNTVTSTFSYHVSRLDGVARLDVRGLVTDDTVGPVEDAVGRLAGSCPDGLILGLARADIAPRLVARLREYAQAALAPGRVMVEAPALPPSTLSA
jgi:hypothetical protein